MPYIVNDIVPICYSDVSLHAIGQRMRLKLGDIIMDISTRNMGVVTFLDTEMTYSMMVDSKNQLHRVEWFNTLSCHEVFVHSCMYVHRGLQVVYRVDYLNDKFYLSTLGTIDELSGVKPLSNGVSMIINSTSLIKNYEPLLIVCDEPHKLPKWARG